MNNRTINIYNNNEHIAVFNSYDFDNPIIKKDLYGNDEFTFTLWKSEDQIENELKFNLVNKNTVIEIIERDYTNIYIVTNITKKRDGATIIKDVVATHISDELIDMNYTSFDFTGNFDGLWTILGMNALGYTYNIDTDNVVFELKYTQETNKKKVLVDALNKLGKIWQYKGKHIAIGNINSVITGAYITVGKNLNGFDAEVDENNLVYYRVDVLELENSTDRKGTKFAMLDSIDTNDFVYLQDDDMGVNEYLRVLAYQYNPFNKMDSNIELSNKTLTIIDNMITKDNLANEILNNTQVQEEIKAIAEGQGGGGITGGDTDNNMFFDDDICDEGVHNDAIRELFLKLTGDTVAGWCYDDFTKILRHNLLNGVQTFKIGWSPDKFDEQDPPVAINLPFLQFNRLEGFKFGFGTNANGETANNVLISPTLGFEVNMNNTKLLIDADGSFTVYSSDSEHAFSIGYLKATKELKLQSAPNGGTIQILGDTYINGVLQTGN